MAKIWNTGNTNAGEDVDLQELPFITGWNARRQGHFEDSSADSYKIKHTLYPSIGSISQNDIFSNYSEAKQVILEKVENIEKAFPFLFFFCLFI